MTALKNVLFNKCGSQTRLLLLLLSLLFLGTFSGVSSAPEVREASDMDGYDPLEDTLDDQVVPYAELSNATLAPPKLVNITLYVKMTEKAFKNQEDKFIEALVQILNTRRSYLFYFTYDAQSVKEDDITINSVEDTGGEYLKVSVSVTTPQSLEAVKKQIEDNKSIFKKYNFTVTTEEPKTPITDPSMKGWVIAIIVVAGVLALALLAGIIFACTKRHRRSSVENYNMGDYGH